MSLRFVPYGDTIGQPNVIVDGRANPSTVLTLSHWPQAISPPALRRDSSAEMAYAYLDSPSVHAPARCVSNNHYDQDGLISVHALTCPDQAMAHRELLVDVAWAGDFAVARSRRAARLSMMISSFTDPDLSPLGAESTTGDYDLVCAALYPEALGRLPEMIADPDHYQALWVDEDTQLELDLAWFDTGEIAVDEVPALDLSVVTLPDNRTSTGGHRFGGRWSTRIHPMALHAHVDGFVTLLRQGSWTELRYRYESWVQFVSRPVRPRADLTTVASELTALEPDGGAWAFDGVDALDPALHRLDDGPSGIAPTAIRSVIERGLRTEPPAWDPYAAEAI